MRELLSAAAMLVTWAGAAAGIVFAQPPAASNSGNYPQNTAGSYSRNRTADDQMGEITVLAAHRVHQNQVGISYTGIPIEQVSLSRHVGYRDLNLNTPSGREQLDKRIEHVAREACHQLQTLHPLEQWDTDNRTCVAQAVQAAKQEVATISASAPAR